MANKKNKQKRDKAPWSEDLNKHGWSKTLVQKLDDNDGKLTVSEVMEQTGRSFNTVMKHLRGLVEEGIAEFRKGGQTIHAIS